MAETRNAVVAGTFYPAKRQELADFIDDAVRKAKLKGDISAAKSYVAPHAGYIYSGKTAAYAFKALSMKSDIKSIDTIVVVGPNHTGYGTPRSISFLDWSTPLGTVENDGELSERLASYRGMYKDESGHAYEHSIEVQLPFLQRLLPGKKACFICMGAQETDSARNVCDAIIDASKATGRNVAVLASSDFNHYASRAIAQKKDKPLFEQLCKMDVNRFYALKETSNESACGYGPIAAALMFAKAYGAKNGVLLHNSDSGDETGDIASVVDYASLCFL